LAAGSAQASGLSSRYATALFDLAETSNALDKVASDLAVVQGMVDESDELRQAMHSPIARREDQADAVTALAERVGLGDLVRNFLGVLARNRRLFALPHVIEAFNAMLAARRGEATAEVISALPLNDEQLAAVKDSVSRYAGKAVQLRASVDPSLVGGLVVRIGSRMVDASLKTRLQQLELAMRGVG
jgi:F-type H+-transporting ATPase subunit delta